MASTFAGKARDVSYQVVAGITNYKNTMIKIDQLIRTKRRTIGLEIAHDGRLIVRAPIRASNNFIESIISEKSEWISRKQTLAKAKHEAVIPKQFINGEQFLYLGESYPLNLVDDPFIPLHFSKGFYLSRHYQHKSHDLFITWYKKQALEHFNSRVNFFAAQAKLTYRSIKINGAKTLWGSCSPDGNLNFCWRLILAPLAVIDYVVAHELAHLVHGNHSKRFWRKVESILPSYQESRKWLKNNGHILNF